jgi:hypothetical protein
MEQCEVSERQHRERRHPAGVLIFFFGKLAGWKPALPVFPKACNLFSV